MIACGKELFIVPKGLATITQTYALIGLSMNTVIGASDAARPAIGRRIVWNEQQSYHTGCINRIDFCFIRRVGCQSVAPLKKAAHEGPEEQRKSGCRSCKSGPPNLDFSGLDTL